MRGFSKGDLLPRAGRRLTLATGMIAALALPAVAPPLAGAHNRQSAHTGHHARMDRFLGHKVG
jgi:hypothetical protein